MILALALLACKGNDPVDTSSTDSQPPVDTAPAWDARFDGVVEAMLQEVEEENGAAVSVAILEGGELTFAHAVGSADPEDADAPVSADTLFAIGSTTKMIASVTALQQVDAGRATQESTLAELLPELEFALDAGWNDQVTLHHMLSHQGAFYDWTPWTGSSDDGDLAAFAYGDFAEGEFFMAPSGKFWNYSNPNFSLPGLIAEELDPAGRYWPDLVVEDVLAPLGMDRCVARGTEVDADYAVGYGYTNVQTGATGPVTATLWDAAFIRPAGLVWCTPTGMVRFADFLMNGNSDVLSDAMRQEITKSQVSTLTPRDLLDYGDGVFVQSGIAEDENTFYPIEIWQHGGNTLGHTSMLYMIPDQDVAISILSSGYGTNYDEVLLTALKTVVELPEPTALPEVEWDPDGLDKHVGTYNDPWNVGEMIITREGDALRIEMPLLTEYGYAVGEELIPFSTDVHYMSLNGTYYDLTFIAEEEGGDSQWVRNRIFVTTREDEVVAFAPAERPKLDKPALDRKLALSEPVLFLPKPVGVR